GVAPGAGVPVPGGWSRPSPGRSGPSPRTTRSGARWRSLSRIRRLSFPCVQSKKVETEPRTLRVLSLVQSQKHLGQNRQNRTKRVLSNSGTLGTKPRTLGVSGFVQEQVENHLLPRSWASISRQLPRVTQSVDGAPERLITPSAALPRSA